MISNFLAAIVVTFCAAGQNPASGVIVIDKANPVIHVTSDKSLKRMKKLKKYRHRGL